MYKVKNLFLTNSRLTLNNHIAVVLGYIDNLIHHISSNLAFVYESVYLPCCGFCPFLIMSLWFVINIFLPGIKGVQSVKGRLCLSNQFQSKVICEFIISVQTVMGHILVQRVCKQQALRISAVQTGITNQTFVSCYERSNTFAAFYIFQIDYRIKKLIIFPIHYLLERLHRLAQIHEIYTVNKITKNGSQILPRDAKEICCVDNKLYLNTVHTLILHHLSIEYSLCNIASYNSGASGIHCAYFVANSIDAPFFFKGPYQMYSGSAVRIIYLFEAHTFKAYNISCALRPAVIPVYRSYFTDICGQAR